MKITMKVLSLATVMLCVTELSAMQPCTLLPQSDGAGLVNRDVCNNEGRWNLFVNALYWQPREEGLDYVIKNSDGSTFINCGTVERAEFDWNGGFRVGAGYSGCGMIQFGAYYTRFTTDGCKQLKTTFPTVLFPVWSNPSTNIAYEQDAKAQLCFSLNMFDVQLSTRLDPNCRVSVMPVLGLRYERIRQNFNINANGGQTSQGPLAFVLDDAITMKNKFEGAGPKVGINSTWGSWCGVSVFGAMELAMIYGQFEVEQKEVVAFSNNVDVTTFHDIKCNKFSITRPNIGLTLGLQWDCQHDCYDICISAGWEQQFFFGQNQLMRFSDDLNPGVNTAVQGDLALQGLTVAVNVSY